MDDIFKKMNPEHIGVESIRIVFGKPQRATRYRILLELIDSLSSDFEKSFDGKTHCIKFKPKDLKDNIILIKTIFLFVRSWPDAKVYLDNECFNGARKLHYILIALTCIALRNRSYNGDEYCNNNCYGMCYRLFGFKRYNVAKLDDLNSVLNKMEAIDTTETIMDKQNLLSKSMCPYFEIDVLRENIEKSTSDIPIKPDLSRFNEEYDSEKCNKMLTELENIEIELSIITDDIEMLKLCPNYVSEIFVDKIKHSVKFDKTFFENNVNSIRAFLNGKFRFDVSYNGLKVSSSDFSSMLICYTNYPKLLNPPNASSEFCNRLKTKCIALTGGVLVCEKNDFGCPFVSLRIQVFRGNATDFWQEQNLNKLCFEYCRSALPCAICPNYDLAAFRAKFEQLVNERKG